MNINEWPSFVWVIFAIIAFAAWAILIRYKASDIRSAEPNGEETFPLGSISREVFDPDLDQIF